MLISLIIGIVKPFAGLAPQAIIYWQRQPLLWVCGSFGLAACLLQEWGEYEKGFE
ncbi:MAG: hypothetical protein A4E52_02235 [Pelotomaculum sp. PtaB.Bin013]|uniref:Uncharacterized protein n=1 Tax=Pelotomaculum isophthalicicum JI TaxID=947010 RepID=A0A9X4QAH4_9FIRM|nr:hypothetical protein [Pelotomaculum isophthalicicum]MDF9410085.1 hypothetical protein [Pelotomaculum isophthalicicum JI]OPX81219.1 MAG: hypothetical protein A4E52_02235 [Pelotomaculum sp. PtaB.Bin013]